MIEPAVHLRSANLTELEYLALNSELNMADGHARQELTDGQQRIVEEFPTLFEKAAAQPVEDLEREAHRAFLHLLGQHSYPAGRVLSCYASSVAMEILARSLATRTDAVALVHPTFDNIPDILRGVGLRLVPVEEDPLHAGAPLPDGVGCVFVTTPNNPTGRVLTAERLAALAAECREKDVVLALDTSFRGFDPRAHYDHYAILESSGCRWTVIEDTGKLWPTLDLKVGLLVYSANVGLPVAKIYSDILLGVSPFILALVERFAEDAASGGLADLHAFIAEGRRIVHETLGDVPGISFPDADSVVSVERVDLGDRRCADIWSALQDRQVYVLPCTQFHWADPGLGERSLRVALARSHTSLQAAVRELRSVLLAG
ncbi:enduracididine biosynthesis enzyme MppP [Microtetraspora fusca]|uniref:enduracididine biosynthesis enzyme MppP n=1 Tax=Microtetraspora fusca TaxID=1997 RepID=UPI00082D8480|nr:enduracididine biosynthesis enzyme MppP [Microtetraspora fusca]